MFAAVLDRFEPAIAQLGEPARFPELYALRERMRRWRFYHQIPTDADAPARMRRAGVRTPVLADDGRDLAAALATIVDMGIGPAMFDAIDDAFPGAELVIEAARGVFGLALRMPGLRRPMDAHELSDGTLRYLSLVAALMSPRPPELLVLDEPENSLHPSLIEPLARLVGTAAERSQVVVTTHSTALADTLAESSGWPAIRLRQASGATIVAR